IDDDGRTRVAIAQGVRIRRLPDRGAAYQGSSGQVGVEPGGSNPEVDLQRSRIADQSLRYEQGAQIESRYECEVVALTPDRVSDRVRPKHAARAGAVRRGLARKVSVLGEHDRRDAACGSVDRDRGIA